MDKTFLTVVALAISTAPSAAMSCRQWLNTPHSEQPVYHRDLRENWAMLDERCHPDAYGKSDVPDAAACTALTMTINKLQALGCEFGTADGWSCPPPHCRSLLR